MALVARIHQLVNEGAQFIIATHSPLLMAYPGATILQLEEKADIRSIAYEETAHFRVTRDFLRDPAKSLAILFEAHAEEESLEAARQDEHGTHSQKSDQGLKK